MCSFFIYQLSWSSFINKDKINIISLKICSSHRYTRERRGREGGVNSARGDVAAESINMGTSRRPTLYRACRRKARRAAWLAHVWVGPHFRSERASARCHVAADVWGDAGGGEERDFSSLSRSSTPAWVSRVITDTPNSWRRSPSVNQKNNVQPTEYYLQQFHIIIKLLDSFLL